ncbi:aminotransferase class I and II [Desulfovibrio sp. X2]|uniref:aminotransferase class I/II-fold pyridoxal phosphate-dependent enzyme n=1 Tax=Desulfovibrio sp. X2 TaxID=941449 RepID=UPI000358E072|nr:8-amino-7-oxononanoate synthase [Desulfovibrio sp. X2]EPR41695.1 aminotransferase class I and II [Desulfovibrio sp. X2]
MRTLDERLDRFLAGLDAAGRRRRLRPVAPLEGGRVRAGGRDLINFSSNDYLGLSRHPLLIARAAEFAQRLGAGSGASRLVTGHFEAVEALEARIAAAKGSEAALVLASGWQCNASVLAALCDHTAWGGQPQVFTDRLAHASMHAGLAAAGARQIRYRHNDLAHLAELLEKHPAGDAPRFIVTESVFSMDGDVTDVAALMKLARAHEAHVYLDEAHATGVLGRQGFGLSVGHGVDIAMGTFSKALGCFGAYVACSARMKDYLVNRCSGLIYATALPPAVLGSIDAAVELTPTLDAQRARLLAHAERMRREFAALGFSTGASATQIIPLMLGEEERALAAARRLEEAGVLGVAIRPPTVPAGTARIRFALSAAHSDADLDVLTAAVAKLREGAA